MKFRFVTDMGMWHIIPTIFVERYLGFCGEKMTTVALGWGPWAVGFFAESPCS